MGPVLTFYDDSGSAAMSGTRSAAEAAQEETC